jgi:hypothetical protein
MSGVGETFGRVKHGWGQGGILIAGNTDRQVGMACEFPQDYATSYTIQFRTSVPGGGTVNPEALVTWSCEGQFVSRRLSIGNGASITGVGQAVTVKMIDNTPANLVTIPPVQYNVSAQVAPGFRGASELPPTLSAKNDASAFRFRVVGIGSVDIPIPADAGVNQVFITVVNDATGPVPDGTGYAIVLNGATAEKEWDVQRLPVWVPINPGATALRLSVTTAVTLVFTVSFGVEG